MFILYNFDKKLWDDVNRKNLMFSIDNALIAAKIKEGDYAENGPK
jgi:hypothetical protein